MRIPYFGPILLRWCYSCNVPVLRKTCSRCGRTTKRVKISPPGDPRPAMRYDLEILENIISESFGRAAWTRFLGTIQGKIVLCNKVPYEDHMDEIIADGQVLGVLRFNLEKEGYEFLPRIEGARRLWGEDCQKFVSVDDGAVNPIINGASVLVPGVLELEKSIKREDPIIVIFKGQVIAVGLAKTTAKAIEGIKRGVAVKTKYSESPSEPFLLPEGQDWDMVIKANEKELRKREKEAWSFIKRVSSKFQHLVVAHSGGKDSLATLLLCRKALKHFHIIYADTGLEFPETIENVRKLGKKLKLNITTQKASQDRFWKHFDRFGPPSRNSRWCCKESKLQPVNRMLEQISSDKKKVLTFLGQRRYESLGRSKEKRVSKNPWIPLQVSAAPIRDWTFLHVYLYILWEGFEEYLNPLYERGFMRIGCWVCPASSMADLQVVRKNYPELFEKLYNHLSKRKEILGAVEEYITHGLWRWKDLPPKIVNFLAQRGITQVFSSAEPSQELRFYITSVVSPCTQGGYSILITSSKPLELNRAANRLRILGRVKLNKDLGVVSLNFKEGDFAAIFADGSIRIHVLTRETAEEITRQLLDVLIQTEECEGCGMCQSHCALGAILLDESGRSQITENCSSCGRCQEYCPTLRYHSNEKIIFPEEKGATINQY